MQPSQTQILRIISPPCTAEKIMRNKRRNTFLALLAIILIVSIISATIIFVSNKNKSSNAAQRVIKSTCASTLYPDLCMSSLKTSTLLSSQIRSPIDVITAAINAAILNVKLNKVIIEKIAVRTSLRIREKAALKDCLETSDNALDELQSVNLDLNKYPSKTVSTDDLLILLSAARTNQRTCIDGLSYDQSDKQIRSEFLDGHIHASRLCSNVLAMIKYISGSSNQENSDYFEQKTEVEEQGNDNSGQEWPKWFQAEDRKLLQTTVEPNVTVAGDGSGDYKTVSEAVAAAPSGSTERYVIKIKGGVYRENVVVPKNKTNLMVVGDGMNNTIITASKNIVDNYTTFDSATFAVNANGFLARDITFQNAAGPSKLQAVALRVSADKTAFYRCGIIAYQDTLFVHSFRQFYVKCFIVGTIDFIFGNSAVLFQNCVIRARKPASYQKTVITAQGRDDPNENTGIVIQRCKIGATSDPQGVQSTIPTYLGRPWKEYSRTIIMQSVISDAINPAGWMVWNGSFALDTLYYGEYQNTGPGANTSSRVTWKGFQVITNSSEAQQFTAENFISGGDWLADTDFPYSLGL